MRFDGATPFVNLQVSHDPGQIWVLVSALTMMTGLMVSLLVRRRRVWARFTPASGEQERSDSGMRSGGQARNDSGMRSGGQERSDSGISSGSGTVNVELGGLARTDNSGWGGSSKLSHRVAGADRASIERVAEGV